MFGATACSNNDDAYIYFQLDEVPKTLDPQTAKTDIELLISQNLYEGLMRYNEKGELQHGVAKSYEKQGLTYTFTLRDGIKWSDGADLKAKDFKIVEANGKYEIYLLSGESSDLVLTNESTATEIIVSVSEK